MQPAIKILATLIVSMRLNELSLIDQVVLTLLVELPRHGFGVMSAIEEDEALSMAISVRRPLVYRAINDLTTAGLIEPVRTETGERGSPRTIYRATSRGKRLTAEWLESIVSHPRDARLTLLAKFALRSRRGLPNHRLAKAQREHFEPMVKSFRSTTGARNATADLVRRWRRESLSAMIGLLRDLEKT